MLVAFFRFFVPLFFAHLLGDFILQTNSSIRDKERLAGLVRHGLIIGFLSYLFLGLINSWQVPVGIAVSHILLDAWKLRSQKGTQLSRFVLDQFGHLAILGLFSWAAGYAFSDTPQLGVVMFGGGYLVLLVLVSGAISAIYVGSFLVELSFSSLGMESLEPKNPNSSPDNKRGLDQGIQDGGRVIGYLERGLIFLFILADYPAGIGFLVAAKSIFRFGELTDSTRRSQAEYIIIGTLLSILIGTAISYLTAAVLKLFLA